MSISPDLSTVAPFWCIDTSFFLTFVHVSVGVCLLFSVTAKKEPSKEEAKEKAKVTKLFTFLVNRSQNLKSLTDARKGTEDG